MEALTPVRWALDAEQAVIGPVLLYGQRAMTAVYATSMTIDDMSPTKRPVFDAFPTPPTRSPPSASCHIIHNPPHQAKHTPTKALHDTHTNVT